MARLVAQEAVVPLSCGDAQAVSVSDRKFLEASVGALHFYKNDLEMAIDYLASHETDASAAMMADCLKTTDALNTTMTVYHEVCASCSLSTTKALMLSPCMLCLDTTLHCTRVPAPAAPGRPLEWKERVLLAAPAMHEGRD